MVAECSGVLDSPDRTGADEARWPAGGLHGAHLPPSVPRALSTAQASLSALVRTTDLRRASADELSAAVAVVRDIERLVANLTTHIAQRAAELAETGRASGPVETLLSTGHATTGRQARRETRRAELTTWWPDIGTALAEGTVSPAAVDALARQTERLSDEQRRRLPHPELLHDAGRLPVDTFSRVLGRVIARIEHSGPDSVDKHARSSFRHWFDDSTGMGRFTGALDPERYEAFTTAIEQHLNSLATSRGGGVTKGPTLAADALDDLVTGSGGRSSHLPHIIVVIDQDGQAETGDGQPLEPVAVQRLSCDAVMQHVVVDEQGLPLNVGRRYRTATGAQWTAIRAMHRSCAWAGCTQPISRWQLHHLQHWRHGGPTDLDNLVPLCTHHHHLVHDDGWQLHLAPDRALTITTPAGQHHTTAPPSRRSDLRVASGPAP